MARGGVWDPAARGDSAATRLGGAEPRRTADAAASPHRPNRPDAAAHVCWSRTETGRPTIARARVSWSSTALGMGRRVNRVPYWVYCEPCSLGSITGWRWLARLTMTVL